MTKLQPVTRLAINVHILGAGVGLLSTNEFNFSKLDQPTPLLCQLRQGIHDIMVTLRPSVY